MFLYGLSFCFGLIDPAHRFICVVGPKGLLNQLLGVLDLRFGSFNPQDQLLVETQVIVPAGTANPTRPMVEAN